MSRETPVTEPLTSVLGKFVSGASYHDLPAEAVSVARLGFIDCLAVAWAGVGEPAVRLLRKTFSGPREDALVSARAYGADKAALFNGTAAHILDYDDVALQGHPSAILVPVILAVAEDIDASGRDMLLAYAIGYEVWADLVSRDQELHHNKGWHPTAVFGVVAAAAAAAKLFSLDATRSSHAIAIAASMTGGLVANFGSMTKSLHVGRAAQAAIQAAMLARNGFTGSRDAIEHTRGYLHALSPGGRVNVEKPAVLASPWRLTQTGLKVKRYPVCYCASRLIDGALDLAQMNAIDLSKVKAIDVNVGKSASNVLRNRTATTGLEAKFSAEFTVALALIAGKVGRAELADAFVNDPQVQKTASLVRRQLRPDVKRGDLPVAASDRVDIIFTDGRTIQGAEVVHARGANERRLTEDELRQKFDDCLDTRTETDRGRIFDQLWALDRLASCRDLMSGFTVPA